MKSRLIYRVNDEKLDKDNYVYNYNNIKNGKNFINAVIDYCDFCFIDNNKIEFKDVPFEKEKILVIQYPDTSIDSKPKIFLNHNYYNITSENSKAKLLKNINKQSYGNVYFIKKHKLQFVISLSDGKVCDYREEIDLTNFFKNNLIESDMLKINQNILPNIDKINNIYTYDKFIENLVDIKIYVDYIYSIIDYCDYCYFDSYITFSREIINMFPRKTYSVHINCDTHNKNCGDEKVLFDIQKKEYKELFKKYLRFNISDPDDREPIEIETEIINIANDTGFYSTNSLFTDIVFIKDNNYLFILSLYDGYIYDFRKKVFFKNLKC